MILNTFILLCKHHHSLSPDLFSACKTEILYPLSSNFSLSSTPSPGNNFSTFCPSDFSCSNYSNKCSHTAFFFFFLVTGLFLLLLVLQLLSHVRLFVTPWTAAHQASLSFTISWSLLRFVSFDSVMPSNHLILCIFT